MRDLGQMGGRAQQPHVQRREGRDSCQDPCDGCNPVRSEIVLAAVAIGAVLNVNRIGGRGRGRGRGRHDQEGIMVESR
jgi:hypothetical protein